MVEMRVVTLTHIQLIGGPLSPQLIVMTSQRDRGLMKVTLAG